jgi:hypothetical protein
MQNCKNCCFAKIKDGHQEKCLADKYKYLQNDEDAKTEDGFFTYDRLCLYKRVADWNKDKTDQEKLTIARDTLFPNVGICLDDDSDDPQDLENIVDQLLNLKYPKYRVGVVIYSHFSKAAARIPKILTDLRYNGIPSSSVFIVQDNKHENETSVFQKLKDANFLVRLSSKSNICLDKCLDVINKKVNDELSQILVFKSDDVLIINKTLVSTDYLNHLDYHKMEEAILNKVTNTEYLYSIT